MSKEVLMRKKAYLENLMTYGYINRGFTFLVLCKKCWVSSKKESKTVLMTILGAKVGGGVSINVFRIEVCSSH